MTHLKTDALVLRRTDFSETSLILAMLTRASGLRSALVKGAKRPKSPFFGALDLYSLNEVVILDRRSSELGLLTEAVSVETYSGLRRNLRAAYASHAVAELLLGLLHDNEPVPELFGLTCRTLGLLARAEPEALEAHLAAFQVQLFSHLGTGLILDRCVLCEKPLTGSPTRIAVSVTSGGVVCSACAGRTSEVTEISPGTLKVLTALGGASPNVVARMRLSGRIQGELRRVLTRMCTHLLGRAPKMARFLHGGRLD